MFLPTNLNLLISYYSVMLYSYLDLGPALPELDVDDLLNEDMRQELIVALDQRIKKKEELREIMITQSIITSFFSMLTMINKQYILVRR